VDPAFFGQILHDFLLRQEVEILRLGGFTTRSRLALTAAHNIMSCSPLSWLCSQSLRAKGLPQLDLLHDPVIPSIGLSAWLMTFDFSHAQADLITTVPGHFQSLHIDRDHLHARSGASRRLPAYGQSRMKESIVLHTEAAPSGRPWGQSDVVFIQQTSIGSQVHSAFLHRFAGMLLPEAWDEGERKRRVEWRGRESTGPRQFRDARAQTRRSLKLFAWSGRRRALCEFSE
jgi:hypothetical protein